MDEPTRARLEARIAELVRHEQALVTEITATRAVLAELRSLLAPPPEPPQENPS